MPQSNRRRENPERRRGKTLIVDMAVALCAVPELGSDIDCARALRAAGFHPLDIARGIHEARALARVARTVEGEFWIARAQP